MDVRVCGSSSSRLCSRPSPRPCLTGHKTGNCANGQVDYSASQSGSRIVYAHAVKSFSPSRWIDRVGTADGRPVADTRSSQGQRPTEEKTEHDEQRRRVNFAQHFINVAKWQRPQREVLPAAPITVSSCCPLASRIALTR